MKKIIAAVLALALVFAFVGCKTDHVEGQVVVPDVYNMRVEEAEKVLAAAGFKVSRTMVPSKEIAADCVINTCPPKYVKCGLGEEISIIVSMGTN
jgi:Uncharacterized protein conserved in bacteria